MITKPIRSKQQFKSLLAKQLGYLPGPMVYPRSKFQEFHKEILLSGGKKGWIHLIFENVGDSMEGEQFLHTYMDVMLNIPGYHWTRSDVFPNWVGNLSEEILHKPIDQAINSTLFIPGDSEYDSYSISTTEKFNKLKALIEELEQTDYFENQLEDLWGVYEFGFTVKNDVISEIPKLLPAFKYIIDEYQERGCITFYTTEIKRKVRVPILEVVYGGKDRIFLMVGKGKLENGKLLSNPKDIMYRYFYRNYPHHIYPKDNQKTWEYKDLDSALEEVKKYVDGNV